MTADELRDEALGAMRRAYVPMPGQRVIERTGWFQVITPSVRHGSMNGIEHAVLDGDVDRAIAEAIDDYRSIGCKFRWTVGPDSAPADLGARLWKRGLERREVVAMVRTAGAPLVGPADIAVERVTPDNFDAFIAVMAAGWTSDASEARAIYTAALAHQRLYLARVDGEPAGAATTAIFPRSAYLRAGVVLPEWRGRGVYRALVAARIADSEREVVTTAARAETSAPALARMGFSEVATYAAYRG